MTAHDTMPIAGPEYEVFALSVDDLGWTKHWLGDLRCDQLLVSVARRPDVRPRVWIRAVESKSASAVQAIAASPLVEPFRKGCDQVVATLDALLEIADPTALDPLIQELRFSTFVEHLASIALAALHPIKVADHEALHVLRTISDLSLRRLGDGGLVLDGVVVCTQYQATVPLEVRLHELNGQDRAWKVYCVRAGAAELNTLLGDGSSGLAEALAAAAAAAGPNAGTLVDASLDSASEVTTPPDEGDLEDRTEDNGSGPPTNGSHGPPSPLTSPSGGVTEPDDHQALGPSIEAEAMPESFEPNDDAAEAVRLSEDLYLACRRRDVPVEPPDASKVIVGPSLIAVSMGLRAGASIRPIEGALDDLAREVGVESVSVENDPARPYHIRFMAARRHRQFPALPAEAAPLREVGSQSYLGLYLGQTLDGRDHVSFASAWPHMLVGGSTGSGKTTFIKALLAQLAKVPPGRFSIVIIDGKGEIDYFGVLTPEHFTKPFPDVILGHEQVVEVLDWVVTDELPRRRSLMLERARQNPTERPRSARDGFVETMTDPTPSPFSPLVVVVDEFAEIMMAGGDDAKRFEQRVQQITQTGRSSLVHLVLATQRPDARVVRGAIKANLDARVALRLPTHHDSMTVLGRKGAERLLGSGDLVFQAAGQAPIRLQGYRV